MKHTYRVYNCFDTPNEGSEDYFDMKTEREAIKLVDYLNKVDYKPKKKVWCYA